MYRPEEDDEGPEPWPENWSEGDEFLQLITVLGDETERGQVLSAAHFMDILLERTLRSFLVDSASAQKLLSGFNAPLGTFSVRITAAHALGLITDREALGLSGLRDLRNQYAHAVVPDSGSDKVKSALAKLAEYSGLQPHSIGFVASTSAIRLTSALLNRPYHAEKRRLVPSDWPTERPTTEEIEARALLAQQQAAQAAPKKKVRPSRKGQAPESK